MVFFNRLPQETVEFIEREKDRGLIGMALEDRLSFTKAVEELGDLAVRGGYRDYETDYYAMLDSLNYAFKGLGMGRSEEHIDKVSYDAMRENLPQYRKWKAMEKAFLTFAAVSFGSTVIIPELYLTRVYFFTLPLAFAFLTASCMAPDKIFFASIDYDTIKRRAKQADIFLKLYKKGKLKKFQSETFH